MYPMLALLHMQTTRKTLHQRYRDMQEGQTFSLRTAEQQERGCNKKKEINLHAAVMQRIVVSPTGKTV